MLLDHRFQLIQLLKTGQGVETYLGQDRTHQDRQVVVKLLRAGVAAPELVARLRHEASVLSQLSGPELRPLVHYGSSGDDLYLVQPFYEGVTLADRLTQGPLPVAQTLKIAIEVLQTLQQAHDLGILHRDVKPGNIIVQPDRARLIDFGLAFSASLDPGIREQAVGTARYLAPEQAGLVDNAVDERSDLYSTGAVIYECLAGQPPFDAPTVGEVLRQHLSLPVPGLRARAVEVPRALEAAVLRLLAKEPAKRYQSATGALRDLREIERALDQGIAEPQVVLGLHDRRSALAEPAFVGRREELDLLTRELELAAGGAGGLVFVAAESGGGKTRLLQEFAGEAAGRGMWILRGQGVNQAAQRPYQLLEGVAEEVAARCAGDPGVLDHILGLLGDRAEAAGVAIPALSAAWKSRPAGQLPEAHGEFRSLGALSTLLRSLGTPEQPAVVLLDDCQWTDGLTAKLLQSWQSETAHEPGHVLIVAAYRSEEVGEAHPLNRVRPRQQISLRPLTSDEVGAMAQSMAGALPAEAVQVLAQLAEGSPFMTAAVLMGLIECGAVVESPTGWRVEPAALADAQTSRRAAIFLARRLELLPQNVLRLLSVGAVLGKVFDVGLAADLLDLPAERVAEDLAEARRRRIVWLDGSGHTCHFVHDKIRESLLATLARHDRTTLHLRAAEHIERVEPSRVFELAYHFDAAGAGERCLPYALAAADLARKQHNLEIAETHFRTAQVAAGEADPATQRRVAENLGDILTLRGAYDEAVVQFTRALELAEDREPAAALRGKLGDVAFKRGDMLEARRQLEGSLRQLWARVPRNVLGVGLGLLWEVLVQVLHSLAPRWFCGRRPVPPDDHRLLALRLYSRLAYVYWFHSGKIRCGWAHLREMNLAERYPPTLELAQAYSEHGPVMTMIPWFSRGLRYVQRSYAIREEHQDVWAQGQSRSFEGVALYASSRYREAIESCLEARRLMERTGDRWEVNTASWHIALAQYRLGDLDDAIQTARDVHKAALQIGDQAAAGISLSAWSRASEGAVPAELIKAQMARADLEDASTNADVLLAEAVRLLGAGEVDRAIEVLRAARGTVRRAGLRQEYVAPILPWLATALRIRLEGVSACARAPRGQVREAAAAARRAVRLSRSYRNNLPHALREQALVSALRGRRRLVRRYLEESCRIAAEQAALFELARSRQALGKLGQALGWPDAGEQLQQGLALEKGLRSGPPEGGPADTLSLADRFTSLVEMVRSIASASDPEAVYEAVRRAATDLLRGDQCVVVDLHGRASGSSSSLETHPNLSRTMVEQAIERGGPVVLSMGDSSAVAESLILSEVRSVLCAPIESRDGFTKACFHVTHARMGGLFSEQEVQLASFIASLAGAALDQMAGSEARFTSLAQNSSDVVTIIGSQGVIDYQTSSVERVFGFQPLQMVGSRLKSWIHPDEAAAVVAQIDRMLATGESHMLVECRMRASNGTWRDTETTVTNLMDEANVHGVVLNTRDVTERRAMEAARLRDTEALRASEDRLRAAMEQAMEASRLKSQFLATMSHEIRTPMNGVLGMAHLLADSPLNPTQQSYLKALRDSGTALLSIINDILDFSKVEAGKVSLEMIDFDLLETLESTTGMFAPEAQSKGIHLSLEVGPDVPTLVNGDPVRLRQILVNLTGNAVKFTDTGSVRLSARMAEGRVRFQVADTGIGVDPGLREHLLDPFVQADASTTRRFGGTGLGLAISHQLVKLMDGRLDYESAPGQGSIFWFEVPLTPVRPVRPVIAPPAPKPAAASLPQGGRVLLVEDSEVNQMVASGLLRKQGYAVSIASNGAEAVQMASAEYYDIILMDCLMPVMDGYEATRRIRTGGPNRRTPIVALTASAMEGDRQRCLNSGMDLYLAKPLDPAELRKVLSQARSAGSGPDRIHAREAAL